MEVFMNDCVIHNICLYLDVDDIVKLRTLSKFFHHKITKSLIYATIEESRDVELNHHREIKEKKRENAFASKLHFRGVCVGLTVGAIILSPLLLIAGLITLPMTYTHISKIAKSIISTRNVEKTYSKKYEKILKMYNNSLSNPKYFKITKYMLNRYPGLIEDTYLSNDTNDIISYVRSTNDLNICVFFKNYKTLDFLLEKYAMQNIQIGKRMNNVNSVICTLDDIEAWKIFEKHLKYTPLNLHDDIIMQTMLKEICFIPKLLKYSIQNGNVYPYEEIYINSCKWGSLSMIKFLIDDKLVDIRCNNDEAFINACKHQKFECAKYLSTQCDAYILDNSHKWSIK